MVVTPPAIPSEDSPLRRDAIARCTATSEDEHPEWTQIDGPCRSFSKLRLASSLEHFCGWATHEAVRYASTDHAS